MITRLMKNCIAMEPPVDDESGFRLCGYMYKQPETSGMAYVTNMLAAKWRRRFFALVAFEINAEKLDNADLDAVRRSCSSKHPPARRYEDVLCWFASERDAEAWLRQLTPAGSRRTSYCGFPVSRLRQQSLDPLDLIHIHDCRDHTLRRSLRFGE